MFGRTCSILASRADNTGKAHLHKVWFNLIFNFLSVQRPASGLRPRVMCHVFPPGSLPAKTRTGSKWPGTAEAVKRSTPCSLTLRTDLKNDVTEDIFPILSALDTRIEHPPMFFHFFLSYGCPRFILLNPLISPL